MSDRTTAYDIKDIGELRFWTDEAAEADVRCSDCDPKLGKESCSWQGDCNENTKSCECDTGFFGDKCQVSYTLTLTVISQVTCQCQLETSFFLTRFVIPQHAGPCTEMILDVGFEGCFSEKDCNDQKSFDLLYDDEDNPVMWLGLPVYSHKESSRYMFFDGNYWNVMQVYDGSSDYIFYHLSKYVEDKENYEVLYVSELTKSSSPANLAFRAMLADWDNIWDDDDYYGKTSAIGRMSEKEFFFLCADCYNGFNEAEGVSICTDESGKVNYDICKTVKNDRHGTVSRCDCPHGFGGPLCQIRPVEGAVTLHLDYGNGFCPICGEGNDWSLWDLGTENTACLPYPKKQSIPVKGTNGTSVSQIQIGLSLSETHFKVFVSINATDGSDLCIPKEGTTKEIFTFSRNRTNTQTQISQIHFDKAIAFDDITAPFGRIVDTEEIECIIESNVDQSFCDESEAVQGAWVQLDVKITYYMK